MAMKFLTPVLLTLIQTLSAGLECPGEYGGEELNIIGYVGNKQFYCSNINIDTGCRYSEYLTPPPGVMPGDCKLRDDQRNGNFITKRYDCGSFYDHWRFGCDMVSIYNLNCKFEFNPEKKNA